MCMWVHVCVGGGCVHVCVGEHKALNIQSTSHKPILLVTISVVISYGIYGSE